MKSNLSYVLLLLIAITLACCNKKYEGETTIEDVKYKNNRNTIPSTKMDSAQAINLITKQKIQDLLDLSTLYISGNKDTEIDSVIYAQMQSYFLKSDTMQLKPLFRDLDSLKVRYANINALTIDRKVVGKDTFDIAVFNVDYFNAKKLFIGNYERKAEYVLTSVPNKAKNEFKFNFKNFFEKPHDSIPKNVETKKNHRNIR